MIPLRRYWQLLSGYLASQRRKVALLAALLLANVGLQLLNPLVLRRFLDSAVSGTGDDTLLGIAVLFIAIAAVAQLVSVAESYLAGDIGWSTTNALRSDVARQCLRLDMTFHNTHTPGELIERIDGDVATLSDFFSRMTLRAAASLLMLAGALAVLFSIDWRIGLAIAGYAAVGLAVLNRIRAIALPAAREDRETSAQLFGYIEERLAGTEDVRARGATEYVMRGLFRKMRDRLRARRNSSAMFTVSFATLDLLFALGTAIAFSMSGSLFQSGALTIGTVYLIVQYTLVVTLPLRDLSQQVEGLQRATASISRVQDLLSLESATETAGGPAGPWNLPAGPLPVDVAGVSFAYPGGDTVLHDVSFALRPGKVLGLLGRTGSGKSTIARLLLRLYDPNAGIVRVGGVNLREVGPREVRDRVGMVTQEVQLFEASVRDNLTFFDRAVGDDRIVETLERLGLSGWYAGLSDELDTPLPAGGAGLSAGEAQLLAFARVFLRNPGLVILDEASSRLDAATEQLVERGVDQLLRGRTGIVIAHRLATLRRADDIVVLERGRIRETGRREDLAADPTSRFADLLRAGLEVATE